MAISTKQAITDSEEIGKIMQDGAGALHPDMQLPPPVFLEMQGKFEEYVPGESLTVSFPVRPEYDNPMKRMQGGFICAAMDNTMGPLSFLVTGGAAGNAFAERRLRAWHQSGRYTALQSVGAQPQPHEFNHGRRGFRSPRQTGRALLQPVSGLRSEARELAPGACVARRQSSIITIIFQSNERFSGKFQC